MQKVVVDSDVVIDHLRSRSEILNAIAVGFSSGKIRVFIPSIVLTEISTGADTRDSKKLALIEKFLQRFEFLLADWTISQKSGFLMRDYPTLSLADAIVAASTLEIGGKLATKNLKDFRQIRELKFFKP